MDIYKGLNDCQLAAVQHLNGPCLIIAGAGSGKTKVLTTRIVNLIKEGIPDYRILAITFTNKAAREMKERLNSFIPDSQAFVGTFHALGVKIIRENSVLLGLNNNFTIIDSDDVVAIIKKILKEMNLDPKFYAPSYIRNRISFIKNEMLSEGEIGKYFNTPPEKIAHQVYIRYQEILSKNNSVDFDDLLKLPVQLFQERPDVLARYQDKFEYILVDEYQDTNEVQYKFCKLLAQKKQNIFVVGDPDQSIYTFRGANFRNILNFEKDYPQTKIIALEENYRSTNSILAVANAVIKNNKERKDKALWSSKGKGIKPKYLRAYDGRHEVTLVINEIKKLLIEGYKYQDIGVLYRTNAQARLVEEEFIKANLQYNVVGSYYFYARKEIKDLIAYLRLVANKDDDISLRRVINVPKRGIGEKTLDRLEAEAKANKRSMYEVIKEGKEKAFKDILEDIIKSSENLSLTELIDTILTKTGLEAELESDKSLENELRLDNLMEFKSITAAFEEKTGNVNLADFLEEVSLIADVSDHKEKTNAVTLMTLHSAKGLEFEVVFLIGMEEGLFPHVNSFIEESGIEEERRLCYVGITRAKQKLYVSNAKRRILYGRETFNPPSRFISEIDEQLLDISAKDSNLFPQEKIVTADYYEANEQEFNSGDIIMHTIYGRGVIVDCQGDFISVAFAKNYGIKKLLKNHKSIKKVS